MSTKLVGKLFHLLHYGDTFKLNQDSYATSLTKIRHESMGHSFWALNSVNTVVKINAGQKVYIEISKEEADEIETALLIRKIRAKESDPLLVLEGTDKDGHNMYITRSSNHTYSFQCYTIDRNCLSIKEAVYLFHKEAGE
jgi:hypothetical protein